MLNALAYNFLCLLRMMLPGNGATSLASKTRSKTRYEIYAAGGHVARHARQLTIKVSEGERQSHGKGVAVDRQMSIARLTLTAAGGLNWVVIEDCRVRSARQRCA